MEPNYYVENITVMNADGDFSGRMKPSAFLRYMEQAAMDHARAFGMDDKFFREHGVSLLVGKQALKFERVPFRGEKLTLTTRAECCRRGSIKRITTVTDADGVQIATADCRWIMVSLAEGHILRQPPWTVEGFWNDSVEEELPLRLHKCKEGLIRAGEWTAHYSLCDLNGHINNAFYLDIACDALPLDVVRKGPVTFSSINYHREVPLGEKMEVFYSPSEQGWYLIGKHNGQTSFECYLEFSAGGTDQQR